MSPCSKSEDGSRMSPRNVITYLPDFIVFNPLTPESNPSTQRCLPRFLLGILIFKGLTARRLYKSFGVKRLNQEPREVAQTVRFLSCSRGVGALCSNIDPDTDNSNRTFSWLSSSHPDKFKGSSLIQLVTDPFYIQLNILFDLIQSVYSV
jgi:hypothetical protein